MTTYVGGNERYKENIGEKLALLTKELVCNSKKEELDYFHTNWLPVCVEGVQWYIAEEYTINNATGLPTLVGKIYKQGANGAVVTTAPIGVIVDGYCATFNKFDAEVVCLSNDGGLTIVKGWEIFDVSISPPISTLYIGGLPVTGYDVVPCSSSAIYDYEKEEVCWDGKAYTKWYVWDKTGDGLPDLVTVLWLDETDTVIPAPDPLLIDNENCKVCTPSISEAYGNDISKLLPSNNFSIQKPDCCIVKITTSAGTFTIQKGVGFYNTSDFQCLITVTSVEIISGSCTLDKVYIIGNKLK